MSYHKTVFWIDPISEIEAKDIPTDLYTKLWLTVLAFFFCLDSLHFIDNIGQKVKEFLSLLQFPNFLNVFFWMLSKAWNSIYWQLYLLYFNRTLFQFHGGFILRDFQTIHLYNFSSLYDIINWLEAINIFRADRI